MNREAPNMGDMDAVDASIRGMENSGGALRSPRHERKHYPSDLGKKRGRQFGGLSAERLVVSAFAR